MHLRLSFGGWYMQGHAEIGRFQLSLLPHDNLPSPLACAAARGMWPPHGSLAMQETATLPLLGASCMHVEPRQVMCPQDVSLPV